LRIGLVSTRFVVNPKPREPSWAHPSSERRHGRLQPARHPDAGAEAPDAPVPAIPVRAGAPAARSGGSGHPGAGGGRRHGGCGHPSSSNGSDSLPIAAAAASSLTSRGVQNGTPATSSSTLPRPASVSRPSASNLLPPIARSPSLRATASVPTRRATPRRHLPPDANTKLQLDGLDFPPAARLPREARVPRARI